MKIKYTVKDGYITIPIYNDMSVRLYMEMKKKNLDITEYPLCITLKTLYSSVECSYSSSYLGGNLLATTSAGLLCQNVEEVHGTNIVEMMDNHGKEDKIEIMKENCRRYCLKCVDKSCKWSLRSSSLHKSNVFKVRRFNDVHTFPEMSRLFLQCHATSSAIAKMICNKYANQKIIYTPADIMSDMKQQYGINMSYIKAYRTKDKALELLREIPRESYRWKYCYPILVVDGTFLKSSHRGTMLTASAQNTAGKIFPLAYVVVDSENDAYWEWFFEMFRQAFGERERMCIVSDRHASILRGASIVYPEVRPSTDYVYVVIDAEQRRNIVCLQKRECLLLDYTHIEAPKYCSAYYTNQYFKKTYGVLVNPLPDETTWDLPTEVLDNVVLPPIVKGKSGRPTKSRRKGLYEYLYTETVTCGLCGKQGHNRRTCRNAQDN
ncbi:uncharacterized protein [Nicotiana tomentosiformis]|uniref:uncharacterized protein n=1 Tax=Nicotiana tomentosiformis TaxID=4098 RepID=UPI00388CB828